MTEETKAKLSLKLIVLGACFLNLAQNDFDVKEIALTLVIILTSLLLSYRQTALIRRVVLIGVAIMSLAISGYALFLPVIFFDYIDLKKRWTLIVYPTISLSFVLINYLTDINRLVIFLFISVVTIYLRCNQDAYLALKRAYSLLEDTSEEGHFILERQNKSLIDEQNLNLSLGIAEERNRIAHDIHDNVGHLLSSSLIQLGALKILNQDDQLKEPLSLISATIEEGMDNIRQSVHDIHDDSVNLKHSVEDIINHIQEHEVAFRYALTSAIDNRLKIDFLMVIREAVANSLKYSNGTKINLELVEHPGFYRLLVKDNGTRRNVFNPNQSGIGITSMKKRMADQAGRLTVEQTATGFQILAIVPKHQGGK